MQESKTQKHEVEILAMEPVDVSKMETFRLHLEDKLSTIGDENFIDWVDQEFKTGRKIIIENDEKVIFDRQLNSLDQNNKPDKVLLGFTNQVDSENSRLSGVYNLKGNQDKPYLQLLIRTYPNPN